VGTLLQTLVSGLAAGVVYALVALGASLLAGLTRALPLAHGDLVAGSVGVGVLAVLGSTPVRVDPPFGSALAVIGLTVLTATGASVLVVAGLATAAARSRADADGSGAQRGADEGALVWAAGAVGAGLLVRAGLARGFPRDTTAVPDPLHLAALVGGDVLHLPGGATVPARLLPAIVVGLVVAVVAERLLVRGRAGAAVRAVTEDPQAAALVGIDGRRVLLAAAAAAGLLTAVAALLVAPDRSLTTDTGVVLGLKALAAALLGGLGSLRGALVAGLLLGVAESVVVAVPVLGPGYADVFALGVLVAVVALRPEGLRARPVPAA